MLDVGCLEARRDVDVDDATRTDQISRQPRRERTLLKKLDAEIGFQFYFSFI
jgi:hypothetical protein